jgi:hypothetical protein
VAEQSARLVFGLVLAGVGLDVTGAFVGTPLALALVALLLLRPLRGHIGSFSAGAAEAGHRLRDLFVRAWVPIAALGLVAWLQDGHIIIVKHLASDDDAGAWAALAVAGKAIMFVAIGLSGYVVPEVARRFGGGLDPRPVLVRVLALIGGLAVPMVLIFFVAGDTVLDLAFSVSGGGGALPLVGLAMSLLAVSYLCVQFQLALHRVRFVLVLLVAAVAMPLLLLAIGSSLTPLGLGLAGLNLVLACVMLSLALPRVPAAGAASEEATGVPVAG